MSKHWLRDRIGRRQRGMRHPEIGHPKRKILGLSIRLDAGHEQPVEWS